MAGSIAPELQGNDSAGPPSDTSEPTLRTGADVLVYVARKLVALVLVLLLVATLTFLVSRATADPSFLMVGQDATEEIIAARRAEMGLDQPMYRQWASYMADLATGDMGISRRTFAPVGGEIWARLPATVELAGAALLLSLLVAIPAGIRAGLRPDGWLDRIVGSFTQLGAAIPNFWLGLMLIYLAFYWLGWFPAPTGRGPAAFSVESVTGIVTIDAILAADWVGARDSIHYLVLPAVTLASGMMSPIFNVTRNATSRRRELRLLRSCAVVWGSEAGSTAEAASPEHCRAGHQHSGDHHRLPDGRRRARRGRVLLAWHRVVCGVRNGQRRLQPGDRRRDPGRGDLRARVPDCRPCHLCDGPASADIPVMATAATGASAPLRAGGKALHSDDHANDG